MYGALASVYDLFMSNSLYDDWAEYIKQFIAGKDGADLACGTGAFTLRLFKAGYNIYGVDNSTEMLQIAGGKARKSGLDIRFINQDINNFKPLKPLDFVICMCDGVNYIKNPAKLFKRVRDSLKSGGVFIFDISTEYKLKEVLGNNTFSETEKDSTYIWKNYYNKSAKAVEMELTFFKKRGEMYAKTSETQVQYIHSTRQIEELLREDFSVKAYGGFSKQKPKETDERIHFISVKK